eukprot:TRINITY_DN20875_c0_g1_i1.p1 TRINITY_DN20875_c0_g1~~TRINITY_DN20875_c0_g1_i1.p1  ORF type:complete len:655 (+),score=81.37 TRINITY_DN20875_c0_g1_i1:449-2413(+)
MTKKTVLLCLLVAVLGGGIWQVLHPIKDGGFSIKIITTTSGTVAANVSSVTNPPVKQSECTDSSDVGDLFSNIPGKPVGVSVISDAPLTSLSESDMTVSSNIATTGTQLTITITSRDSQKSRTCRDGDLWEINANSATELVGVQVRSLGLGRYTGTFTPRLQGTYNVCRKLLYTSRIRGAPRVMSEPNSTYLYGAFRDSFFMKNEEILSKHSQWCPGGQRADIDEQCVQVVVTGKPTLPNKVCPSTWKDGLKGSWVFVPEKDGKRTCSEGICVGDLHFMRTDGWVYVPNSCYLRIYNRESSWKCLSKKSILMVGDSTLRQTSTNLLELVLGTPALGEKSFKWVWANCNQKTINMNSKNKCKHSQKCLGKYRASAKCPDYNSIREWAGKRPNPYDSSDWVFARLIWGGGRKKGTLWGVRPAAFDHFSSDGCKYKYGCSKQRGELEHSLKNEKPDIIFLNGFLWDQDNHDWKTFYSKVNETISYIKKTSPTTSIHFNNAHPQCTDDRRHEFPVFCWRILIAKMQQLIAAESNELLLQQLAKDHPYVVISDRYTMALSHLTHEFCHQGMHFGSSVADCLVFDVDQPNVCLRNWRVDKFMQQLWLNHACPADVLPLSDSNLNVSILSGVPDHLGNWLNRPTAVNPNDLFKQYGTVVTG